MLDLSIENKTNSAIQKDDAMITISVLLPQNDNLGGLTKYLLDILSVGDFDRSTNLQVKALFIRDKLKCDVKAMGRVLTYDEILTVMQVLLRKV